jgi:hypothetical protein
MKAEHFTMKRRTIAVSVGVFLICLVVCAVLFQVAVYGCLGWECAPQRPFKVLDLDVPAGLFPREAVVNSLYPLSEGEGTTENGAKPVYWNQGWGRAIYEVLRFPSARQASEMFPLQKKSFADSGAKEPWQRPSALTFVSPKADAFFVGCGNWSEYRCGMIARYAEYIVQFNATIDSEMTYKGFEKIVAFIDNQISTRLYP